MNRPTLVYYDVLQFQPENRALLERYFEVLDFPAPDFETEDARLRAQVVFAPLGYEWGDTRLEPFRSLKILASNTTGIPHIDLDSTIRRRIEVISLKDDPEFLQGISATAELTWGLILALVRRIPWAFQAACDARWDRRPFGGPAMLSRMSLGVVGLGRLGRMVAHTGKAFGMTVSFWDRRTEEFGNCVRALSLRDVVASSDIVSVHLTLSDETCGLFDAALFDAFKPGSYFINTARGELVNYEALVAALERGTIAGAALDVLDGECDRGFTDGLIDHPVIRYARSHNNLIVTPHIGGSTLDAWRETEERTIRRVLDAMVKVNV